MLFLINSLILINIVIISIYFFYGENLDYNTKMILFSIFAGYNLFIGIYLNYTNYTNSKIPTVQSVAPEQQDIVSLLINQVQNNPAILAELLKLIK
jgi:hypothetical protein